MIDPKLFTVERMLATFLDDMSGNNDRWRKFATIDMAYVPRFAAPGTRPIVVVRFGESFLRHSAGPRQGFFWDMYGDNFLSAELALVALLQAPVPPSACDKEKWRGWHREEQEAAANARTAALEPAGEHQGEAVQIERNAEGEGDV